MVLSLVQMMDNYLENLKEMNLEVTLVSYSALKWVVLLELL